MYSACLFCNGDLGTNAVIERFPIGRRLAFDQAKGRLWVVCGRCARWNLTPAEERHEAIEDCERRFRGTFTRISTDNIGLARLPEGLELVRIGQPLRPEFAAWRYGSRFLARRRHSLLVGGASVVGAGIAAATLGAVFGPSVAAGVMPVAIIPTVISVGTTVPLVAALAAKDYLNDERVIARVPAGRRLLTVRARHMDNVDFRVDRDGGASLTFQHERGWHHVDGGLAMQTAGTILAMSNRDGAPARRVEKALHRIDARGTAIGFLEWASDTNRWRSRTGSVSVLNRLRRLGAMRMDPTERLAMEMAVHEENERRALDGELAELERAWRDADEIATICDIDLSPPKLYE